MIRTGSKPYKNQLTSNALIATKLYNPHLSFLKLFSSDTTQMADAMQIPTVLSVTEEKERLTVLQIAASVGPKTECRFPSTRATIADLLDLLQVSNHLTCFCYITHSPFIDAVCAHYYLYITLCFRPTRRSFLRPP
jgi:hypothetical protein